MGLPEIPSPDAIWAELARREMFEYLCYIWQGKTFDPLQVGRHTKEICNEIDGILADYRQGKSSFIILTVPPQHGKSEIVSRMLPTRFLGEFTDSGAMIVSYSASLAESFSKEGRKIMRLAEYQNVFPRVRLARDNAGVQEWGLEVDGKPALGKAQFSGLEGSNTGKGAALIVVDDPLKGREEAESELIREKVWTTFRSDIISRRAPVSIVIITLTRWHTDDLVGKIQREMEANPEFPKFKILEWPATCDRYEWLFPERYSPEHYRMQKALAGAYAWSALYLCNPVPREGNVLRADKVKILSPDKFNEMTKDLRFARGWDLASGIAKLKEDPDFTSGCKVAVDFVPTSVPGLSMPILYIADYVRGRWEAPERNKRIVATALGDGDIIVGVEAFGGYKDAYTTIQGILSGIRTVVKSQLPGDKVTKADLVAPIFEAGNVFMLEAPWNDDVIKQYTQFPGSAHDDDVDSLVVAYDSLIRRGLSTVRSVSKDVVDGEENENNPSGQPSNGKRAFNFLETI